VGEARHPLLRDDERLAVQLLGRRGALDGGGRGRSGGAVRRRAVVVASAAARRGDHEREQRSAPRRPPETLGPGWVMWAGQRLLVDGGRTALRCRSPAATMRA